MSQDLPSKEPHPTAAGQTAPPEITLSDARREALTRTLQQIAGRKVVDESSSANVRLLAQIGFRFGGSSRRRWPHRLSWIGRGLPAHQAGRSGRPQQPAL